MRRRSRGGTGHPFTGTHGWAGYGPDEPRGRPSTNHTVRCETQNSQARSPRDWRKLAHANPIKPATSLDVGRPSGVASLDLAIETDQKRNARGDPPWHYFRPGRGGGCLPSRYVGAGFPVTSSGRRTQIVTAVVGGQSLFLACVPRFHRRRSQASGPRCASCLSG